MCHRALKACAQIMGIKDLHCKVEANTRNYQAIVRAFFDALVHQVTNFLPSLVLKTVYFGSVEHSNCVLSRNLFAP